MSRLPPISTLEISMKRYESETDLASRFSPAEPWTGPDAGAAARARRKADICRMNPMDAFKLFDRLYFPPQVYSGSYAEPNGFHEEIITACTLTDKNVTLIAAPNGCGKTVTIIKWDIFSALTGRNRLIVYGSETLVTPHNILRSIPSFIRNNARLCTDFPDIEFLAESEDYLLIRTRDNGHGTAFRTVSEYRAARGMTAQLFDRPDLFHVEDFENRMSSMKADAVEQRWLKLVEYRNALAPDGCMTITANNFDIRCLTNRLVREKLLGMLDRKFHVQVFPAWGPYYDKKGNFYASKIGTVDGPLWKSRYPVESKEELRDAMSASDDADWAGQQQEPKKPSGNFFKSAKLALYDGLPGNLVGITYIDPNLSMKEKGDRTCSGALLYSFDTNLFYAAGLRYRSYSDSDDLLADARDLAKWLLVNDVDLIASGMDGNVNQESTWTNNLLHYCKSHGFMLPPVHFKKYNVEWISKNAQLLWVNDKIRMPKTWLDQDEEKSFYDDLWAFTGRKLPGASDDGPDWLCCAVQLLTEFGIGTSDGSRVVAPANTNKHGFSTPKLGRF
jgi:hypothetical protein